MEAANQSQLQIHALPLIIVIKGESSSRKREIAVSLAKFLHYPLLDEDDITPELKGFSPYDPNHIPFYIIRRITKTQLQLKLQLVINLSSYQDDHIDSLLEMAVPEKANLVIVECITGTGDSYRQAHQYRVAPARLLTIEMSRPFNVQDFVSTLMTPVKSLDEVVLPPDSSDNVVPPKIFKQSHAHEFSFIKEPKIDSTGKVLVCNQCENLISGPTYQCVVCDDFILHKSCAEEVVVPELRSIARYAPFYQSSDPGEYNFRQEYNCKLCDNYDSRCNHCLLQTHIKTGLIPTVVQYEDHIHPLSFVIMPFWFNYQYKCIACDKYGKSISYKCYGCYMDFHITCAIPMLHEVVTSRPIIALGPWGGDGDYEWDDGIFSTVRQLSLKYDLKNPVNSTLCIEYDNKGESRWSYHPFINAFGGHHDVEVKIDHPNEYLISIDGDLETIRSRKLGKKKVIGPLTFHSNKKTYGPFGDPLGETIAKPFAEHFSSTKIEGHKIVGFFGRSAKIGDDEYMSGIGIYLSPI